MIVYKYTFSNEDTVVEVGELLSEHNNDEVLMDFEVITNNNSDIEIQKLFDDNDIKYIKTKHNV